MNTPDIGEPLRKAVDRQFPRDWLDHYAVEALPYDHPVMVELPMGVVRAIKAWAEKQPVQGADGDVWPL